MCVDQQHKTKKWKHRKGHEARKNPDDLHQGQTPPCEDQTKTNDIQPRTSNHSIASNHHKLRHTKSLPFIVSSSRSPAFFLPSRRRLHHAPAQIHQDSMCHVTTKTLINHAPGMDGFAQTTAVDGNDTKKTRAEGKMPRTQAPHVPTH